MQTQIQTQTQTYLTINYNMLLPHNLHLQMLFVYEFIYLAKLVKT